MTRCSARVLRRGRVPAAAGRAGALSDGGVRTAGDGGGAVAAGADPAGTRAHPLQREPRHPGPGPGANRLAHPRPTARRPARPTRTGPQRRAVSPPPTCCNACPSAPWASTSRAASPTSTTRPPGCWAARPNASWAPCRGSPYPGRTTPCTRTTTAPRSSPASPSPTPRCVRPTSGSTSGSTRTTAASAPWSPRIRNPGRPAHLRPASPPSRAPHRPIDLAGRRLHLAGAGHPPPLLRSPVPPRTPGRRTWSRDRCPGSASGRAPRRTTR